MRSEVSDVDTFIHGLQSSLITSSTYLLHYVIQITLNVHLCIYFLCMRCYSFSEFLNYALSNLEGLRCQEAK
uniref:Uncharacterized protein n=1 Tax=Arundo donax TaxID=35708 RepID=A0A0A9AI57_ARUDO